MAKVWGSQYFSSSHFNDEEEETQLEWVGTSRWHFSKAQLASRLHYTSC